jgi:hypothetical protein
MLLAPLILVVAAIRPRHFALRGGWVRRNVRTILGSAHPLEKSASGFEDASIHCLFLGQMTRQMIVPRGLVTLVVTL